MKICYRFCFSSSINKDTNTQKIYNWFDFFKNQAARVRRAPGCAALTPHSGAAEEAARPGCGLPGLEGKHGPGAIPRPDPPAGLLATTPTPRRAVAKAALCARLDGSFPYSYNLIANFDRMELVFDASENIWRRIEVVITGRTRNALAGVTGSRVRIPPSPPDLRS